MNDILVTFSSFTKELWVFFILTLVLFGLFMHSIFRTFFKLDKLKHLEAKTKQLKQFEEVTKKEEDGVKQLIEKANSSFIEHLIPDFLKKRDTVKLNRDLKLVGWHETMNAEQFITVDFILKVLGVVLGVFLSFLLSPIFGIAIGVALLFGLGFLLNNSVNEKKQRIFSDFPNFIRIIQGYLVAGIELSQAIEEAYPYMSETWQEIMKGFIVDMNMSSLRDAIQSLNEELDVFEVQEFFSLIKLNLEQGINVKESFDSQREKIIDMQYEAMLGKIQKRQMMATILQAPLLLTMIIAFGLPTIYQMVNMGF